MAIEVVISNATSKTIKVNFRVGNNPVREVGIQPRAINNKIILADETELAAFRDSAKGLIDAGILIEGSTNEKKLVANNKELAKEAQEKRDENNSKVADKVAAAADGVNAVLDLVAEKVEKDDKPRKKYFGRNAK